MDAKVILMQLWCTFFMQISLFRMCKRLHVDTNKYLKIKSKE